MSTSKSIQIILARQLASSIATPILLVDAENALIYYNEPAEAIFNQRFDETGEMPAAEWTARFAAVDDDRNPIATGKSTDDARARRAPARLPDDVDPQFGRRVAACAHHRISAHRREGRALRRDEHLLGDLR